MIFSRNGLLAFVSLVVNVQGQIWDCPNCDPRGPGNAPGGSYTDLGTHLVFDQVDVARH